MNGTEDNPFESPPSPPSSPDEPPFQPGGPVARPEVVRWYRIYSICMALLYVVCLVFGAVLLVADLPLEELDMDEARIQGGAMLVVGILFAPAYFVAALSPRAPWGWIYGFVTIGIGMTSCCCLPATIPLLIFWMKPETKAFFYS